jgi:hypothetical protein
LTPAFLGRHARIRAIIRGAVSPANLGICSAEAVSRDVGRVASDVSVGVCRWLLSPTTTDVGDERNTFPGVEVFDHETTSLNGWIGQAKTAYRPG